MKKDIHPDDISFKNIPYLIAIATLTITLFYFPQYFLIYVMALIGLWYIREFFLD